MHAFERLVGELLSIHGYWIRQSYKISLTSEEKALPEFKNNPRPEIDILAYHGGTAELLVVECKSLFNSAGVSLKGFGENPNSDIYKLFNQPRRRDVVLARLKAQLVAEKAIGEASKLKLCLACANVARDTKREELNAYFEKNQWKLFDDEWMRAQISALAQRGYEDRMSTLIAKLLSQTE